MFLIHLNHTAGHLAASIDRARLTCFGQKMNEISYIDRDDIEYATRPQERRGGPHRVAMKLPK